MARWNLLMAATALTAGTLAGCAHYDTVDDFPVPCVGANCAGPAMAYAGPTMGGPATAPPSTVESGGVNAPPSGELGPFGSQGGASGGAEGDAAPVPSNPNPPGDPGLLPPSDSPPAAPPAPGL
jgi:hypothetical protein